MGYNSRSTATYLCVVYTYNSETVSMLRLVEEGILIWKGGHYNPRHKINKILQKVWRKKELIVLFKKYKEIENNFGYSNARLSSLRAIILTSSP